MNHGVLPALGHVKPTQLAGGGGKQGKEAHPSWSPVVRWQRGTAFPTAGTTTAAKQTKATPQRAGLARWVQAAPSPLAPHIPACPGQLAFVIHHAGMAPAVQPPARRHSRSHTQISPQSSSSKCWKGGLAQLFLHAFPKGYHRTFAGG